MSEHSSREVSEWTSRGTHFYAAATWIHVGICHYLHSIIQTTVNSVLRDRKSKQDEHRLCVSVRSRAYLRYKFVPSNDNNSINKMATHCGRHVWFVSIGLLRINLHAWRHNSIGCFVLSQSNETIVNWNWSIEFYQILAIGDFACQRLITTLIYWLTRIWLRFYHLLSGIGRHFNVAQLTRSPFLIPKISQTEAMDG